LMQHRIEDSGVFDVQVYSFQRTSFRQVTEYDTSHINFLFQLCMILSLLFEAFWDGSHTPLKLYIVSNFSLFVKRIINYFPLITVRVKMNKNTAATITTGAHKGAVTTHQLNVTTP